MAERSRSQLMSQLAVVRKRLADHGIRDAPDYAEVLVAEALGGTRVASGVNRGHDVVTVRFGRVEVKCRQLPLDGRVEERIELKASKKDGFDHLAIVIFHPDFGVKGAVLVPYADVWGGTGRSRLNRTSYKQACAIPVRLTSRTRSSTRRLDDTCQVPRLEPQAQRCDQDELSYHGLPASRQVKPWHAGGHFTNLACSSRRYEVDEPPLLGRAGHDVRG